MGIQGIYTRGSSSGLVTENFDLPGGAKLQLRVESRNFPPYGITVRVLDFEADPMVQWEHFVRYTTEKEMTEVFPKIVQDARDYIESRQLESSA